MEWEGESSGRSRLEIAEPWVGVDREKRIKVQRIMKVQKLKGVSYSLLCGFILIVSESSMAEAILGTGDVSPKSVEHGQKSEKDQTMNKAFDACMQLQNMESLEYNRLRPESCG